MVKNPKDFNISFIDEFVDEDAEEQRSSAPQPPGTFLKELAETTDAEPHYSQVLLSTLPTVPGMNLVEMKGVISGRVVKGQGTWKAIAMSLSDAFGRRSSKLEKEFVAMERECFLQMKEEAFRRGANAIVGVSLQFGEASGEANLFYAVATGTAVIAKGGCRAE